jgi:hypothetical protein
MVHFNKLMDKINNAKQLDFSDIISDTIELFKKVWLKGLIVVLFVLISALCIAFLFSLIGVAPALNTDIFNDGFDIKEIASFYSTSAIYGIPQNMLLSTLNLAFVAAFYRICKQIVSGESSYDDYFYFFKKEYFTKVFMLGIIYTCIATIAQFLCIIPYIYAFVPLSYFAVILAHNPDLSEGEIVKASFALGNKKWLITFGTMIVAILIAMLGLLGCIIGIIFTVSIIYLPSFLIYKDAIGFDDNSAIDEIGNPLE